MAGLSSSAANKRVKFKNPPVNELVIALYHLPIREMKAQHIGIYWDRIRDRYPQCKQQPLVGTPDLQLIMETPGEFLPLPRFWFFSDNRPTLIQIQQNAFMFNWRRLEDNEYPHYETVGAGFWQEFEHYKSFVQEQGWQGLETINRCELTYVNIIPPNELFAKPSQIMNVVPSVEGFAKIQEDELVGMNATATYQVNPAIRVNLTIKTGQRRDETKEVVASVEIKAYGVPKDLSLESARPWYDAAHDATYKMFLSATARQMQEQIWKP